ncbi:acyl-CoA thioesterase [Deinococcus detaillensis]|uniref:Acyl-CoA thioesterase n=1 Tax=Deinococcus detaillensis TaxID=2592048 RepID=A0A553V4E1_9DEIO|nr:thioesterase family protein [Deinococcus detaillensis]TSA87254.1 acyl-CoA thioesterase [Deinococcus detaillensis]
MPPRPPPTRAEYPVSLPLQTRWADNDLYGHVNNAAYYTYFDTAVNSYLIQAGVLDIHAGDVIGLIVETGCVYFAPLAFPDSLSVGLRVAKLGRSSVRYELAVFREGEDTAAAAAHFVHVYVDRQTRRPLEVSGELRRVLEGLLVV